MVSPTEENPAQLQLEASIVSQIQLSRSVSLYRPNITVPAADSTDPRLILLATWMDARDIHISKYIVRYQTIYPNVPILVVKSSFRHFLFPNSARSELRPAVEVIYDALNHLSPLPSSRESSKPRLLIHVFSNGGSCMLYYLYEIYAESESAHPKSIAFKDKKSAYSNTSSVLPSHVTIFDSVPGRWSYSASTGAVLGGIPAGLSRRLAFPMVHLLGLWWFIKYVLVKIPEETHVWGLAHNDQLKANEVCRSYIYSQADQLVHYLDVEEHADHAEASGFVVVRREMFHDSQHVAHARSYPDRYWAVVKDTWEAGQCDSSED